jgi:hypothetical protein
MKSNNFGFAAAILCVLLLSQVGSNPSVTINTSNGLSIFSSESLEITPSENTISESSLSAIEHELVVPQGLGTVVIVVESSLYSSISAEVIQYRQDLNDTGYHTILYTNPISTAEELKANLSGWYDSEDILGAVLIGRLPYAQYYHPAAGAFSAETFICDLFLTDLDGTWSDTNPTDGIYDAHSSTTGTDIFPEIFLGRIDPTCLSWGTSVVDHINTYLARIHNYRTGGVTRSQRALFYIDDDWEPWDTSWSNDAANAYSTRTLVSTPTTTTTASDWVNNRVNSDYQWGHLAAHSSATTHYFGPGGSGEGTATSTQIRGAPPSFNFYNLFCCSGAKWTVSDNLGVTYTFSGSYSLASIGSSKTGSMLSNDNFYDPLGQNATLGESLRDWFSESLTSSSEAGSAYLEWFYGMNIIGDPLLSINYDTTVQTPKISSDSHPDSSLWYNNPRPQMNWTVPPEVNQIAGYYYLVDQNPATIPDDVTGTFTTINGTLPTEDLASGTWYYHVVAVDSVGNIGEEAAHYVVKIDVEPPEIALINPALDGYSSVSTLTASWTFQDNQSSHTKSIVWIDTSSNVVHNSSTLECVITGLTEGVHVINVTSYDEAMNCISVESTFNIDRTGPVLVITNPIDEVIIGSSVTIEWDASDTLSGYQMSVIYLDDTLIATTLGSNKTIEFNDLSYGPHIFNITAYDMVNNTASVEIVVTLIEPVIDTLLLISTVAVIGLVIVLVIVFRRRR